MNSASNCAAPSTAPITVPTIGWLPYIPAIGWALITLIFSAGLAAAVLFLGAVGEAAPKTVKIWDFAIHDKKYKEKAYKSFNKSQSQVKIEYTSQANATYEQVLNLAFTVGEAPDVFYPIGQLNLLRLIELGRVIPLNKVAPDAATLRQWMARFPEEAKPFVDGANVIDGKVYTWPLAGRTGGGRPLFYNKTLFKKAGIGSPPRTWSEMREAARKVTQAGNGKFYGITHGIKDVGVWAMDLSIAGTAGWYSSYNMGLDLRTGKYVWNHPILRKAIQLWIDMRNDGSVFPGDFTMTDEDAKKAFSMDRAAMIFGGYWNPGNFLAYNPNVDFDVVLAPTGDDGVRRGGYDLVVPTGSHFGYLVSSSAKDLGAVWKLIDLYTSLEFQEGWVKAGGGISIFPEANKPEYFPHPSLAKIAEWGLTAARVPPPWPAKEAARIDNEFMEWPMPSLLDLVQGIYLGKVGFEALDDINKKVNDAFDKAIVKAQAAGLKIKKEDFIFPDWDQTKDYVAKKGR